MASFKLAVRFSGKLVETLEFDKDQVTIGRAPDCDVVVDNLGVSRVHVQIERTGDFFILRDLKSNNGTFVRGEKIAKYNLNHSDEFFLGKHSITFLKGEEDTEDEWLDSSPNTEVIQGGGQQGRDIQGMTMSMDAKELALMQIKKKANLAAYLTITTDTGFRKQFPITKTATFFGTNSDCEFPLEGWFINKRHVVLLREDSGFRIIHLGNKKPPKINGQEVDDHKLKHSDVIEVENIRATFNIGSP